LQGQKVSANISPRQLMFNRGAGTAEPTTEQRDGTQPAEPRWPWKAEVSRPCKRAFTNYLFQLSVKTVSKQKAAREVLPAGLHPPRVHGRRPRFSLSINRSSQSHSGP